MNNPYIQQDGPIQIVCDTHSASELVALGIFLKSGALNEAPEVLGASHFLEHLAFKGDEPDNPNKINQSFEKLGARHNAYTSLDHTCYFAYVHRAHAPAIAKLLVQMLFPQFTSEQFALEKEVILEEIQMYEDQPESILSESLQSQFFGVDNFSILGSETSIKTLGMKDLRHYHSQAYAPENTLFVISGNIDQSSISDVINNQYAQQLKESDIEMQNAAINTYLREFPRKTVLSPAFSHRFQSNKPLHMSYLQGLLPAPDASDINRHAARIWAELVSGDNSYLYNKMVNQGLAEEVSVYAYSGDGLGYIHFYCTHEPESEIAEEWVDVIRKFADPDKLNSLISQVAVERVKSRLITQTSQSLETSMGRMRHLGESWIEGKPLDFHSDVNELKSMNLRDLQHYTAECPIAQLQTGTLTGSSLETSS